MITADILEQLRDDLAARPATVVVFVGRDGFPLAEAARGLDPAFVHEHCRTVALSRVVLEHALRDLETHTGRELGLPAAFRLTSADDPQRRGSYRQLTRYLHGNGVAVGREHSAVAVVDTSYKGTSQEMLAAAYPATVFSGHFAFFGAHPQDPHPGTKTGHALHRDPDPAGGLPTAITELPAERALTFAHPEAIAAVEDLHHGTLAKPRGWAEGEPELARMRTDDLELLDINPARLAAGYTDALTREAAHDAALLAVGDVAAAAGARRRAGDPDWRAELDTAAAAFTDQLRTWIDHPDPHHRPGLDARLGRVLDGFAHRQDRDAVHHLDALLRERDLPRDGAHAHRLWRELAAAGTRAERHRIVVHAPDHLTGDIAVDGERGPAPDPAPGRETDAGIDRGPPADMTTARADPDTAADTTGEATRSSRPGRAQPAAGLESPAQAERRRFQAREQAEQAELDAAVDPSPQPGQDLGHEIDF